MCTMFHAYFLQTASINAPAERVPEVQICCVACDGACLLRSHRAQAMVNAWTSDQFQPLLAAGINEQARLLGRACQSSAAFG